MKYNLLFNVFAILHAYMKKLLNFCPISFNRVSLDGFYVLGG